MKTTTSMGSCSFADFLSRPIEAPRLDLRNSNLIDCINSKIEVRQRVSPRYGKTLFSLIKSINDIQSQYGCIIYPAHINEEFWSLFLPYLMHDRQYSNSSARTIASQLKAAVEWASHYGAKIDPTYNECILPPGEVHNIALTPDDVSRIYHFDVDSVDRRIQYRRTLQKVKDMFCLMCNIGLRYSDACRLNKEHFKDGVVDILQQKTKMYAHVDVDKLCIHKDMVSRILEKYDYCAPCRLDLSNFDKYLHSLMVLCGFDDSVIMEYVRDGDIDSRMKEKHTLITSHTARRTFVVYNALRGIPPLSIMRATGHKTFSAFQKYLCYS